MTITAQEMIQREVCYCVSSLIHTLATAYGAGVPGEAGDLADMIEQAFELSTPLQDYEEAAIQEGWYLLDGGPDVAHDEHEAACENWQHACEKHDIEPYDREVYEHWIVSDWLADRLAEKGEKVDKDFAGLTVWARTTTGQAIYMDSVIEAIHADLVSRHAA